MRGRREGVLIAGGGTAGCLAALALARRRPEVPLLIVEERPRFGGDAFHWLFDAELSADERALVEPLIEQSWPGFYVAFPDLNRNLKAPLVGFGPDALHRAMTEILKPAQYRLATRIVAVRGDALELEGGETVKAEGAIDARGPANLAMLELLYETRVERVIRTSAPHRLDRPLLIDATVEQNGGFSFAQAFPLDSDRMRIAQVLVSERASPDETADARLDTYLTIRGWNGAQPENRSSVTRPLPIGGDFDSFWRIGGARVARLGLRGGFLQPTSGRTAPDAIRNALLLAEQRDFSGEALHDAFEAQAKAQWRRREFARDVNAALAACSPNERHVLAGRLYRLGPGPLLKLLTEELGLIGRRQVQQALRSS
ncbi:MAG: lycopene cyclase family protein [Allosphingosinicella sp.]